MTLLLARVVSGLVSMNALENSRAFYVFTAGRFLFDERETRGAGAQILGGAVRQAGDVLQ